MNEELKPCPFCGGEAWIHRRPPTTRIMCIKCCDCGVEQEDQDTDEQTVAAWNARPEEDRLREALERIRASAEDNLIAAIADDALEPKEWVTSG